MFSKCNSAFLFPQKLAKAKKQFIEEKNCEKSLRYIISKFNTDKAEDKIIDNAKNTNAQVKQIFEENFNREHCEWAIRHVLAGEKCSKANIDDIMLEIAPVELELSGQNEIKLGLNLDGAEL